ncbi:major facilitator superfamily domain-containing protein [Leucosporidium creatinivorum]|uniref:Lysosomal dipeptide transporter MFSD1 n=1 Tax=Leucosporidium creatinivorum TaxID=106004 RepID=A0A1Y2F9T3_9BASI|nr:major facilitator superfamily domain-containing protein [Leucosporidium creatinivorum]
MATSAELAPQLPSATNEKARLGEDDGDGSSKATAELSSPHDEVDKETTIPWRYKGPALAMILLFNLSTYWFSSALGPLKTIIKKDLHIDNAAYGVLASSNHLVNTVVPLLSGVFIDYFGAEYCSLYASTIMLVGAVLSGAGAQKLSYPVLVTGEVIFGLGNITMQTSQLKLFSFWFFGKHLGFAFGLENAMNRIIVVIAKATAVPIRDGVGWTWVIWIPVFLSAFVLAVNITYVLWEKRIPAPYRSPSGRQLAKLTGAEGTLFTQILTSFKVVTKLPAFFWLLAVSQFFQNGVAQTYIQLQADMITQTRGTKLSTAGWMTAVGQAPIVFLSPMIGLAIDRWGCRMHYTPLAAFLFLLCFILMQWTQVNGIAMTVIQGLAISVNVTPMTISIPLLCSSLGHVGTGEGTYQAFINSGSVIVAAAAGAIQDRTPTGRDTYKNVLIFFIALKAFYFVLGCWYIWFDRYHLNGILTRSERAKVARDARLASGEETEKRARYRDALPGWTFLGIGVGVALIIVAWVVYLVYSQGS